VLFLSACALDSEPPLRIGTNTWPGYEPLYLARNLGSYDNTAIKLVELNSASEVIHALRSGNLEGAALTLDEALTVIEDGFDLKVILVLDFSNGGDVLLVKPYIDSLDELRNKKIAVECTTVGALLLDAALRHAQLTADDIEIISCSLDEQLSCYEDVDALVTFEPVRTKLMALGAKVMFDSSQIPGRIVDVLVVKKQTIIQSPQTLKRLIGGYFKARAFLKDFPQEAGKLMGTILQLSVNQVLSSYKGLKLPDLSENHVLLGGTPSPLTQTANSLALLMEKKKFLKKSISFKTLTDNTFLPKEKYETRSEP